MKLSEKITQAMLEGQVRDFSDAYQGAMEEVAIWKRRALEAEDLNRKFIAEINGPTHMGEPVQNGPSVPDGVVEALQRLIENGAVLGSASAEDALLVARYRQRLLACAPSIPEGWLRAIDEALVVAHIGVADKRDTYEQAKEKLNNLIGFHVDVATDPAVNGGYKLVSVRLTPKTKGVGE